ncbi:MAG: hypothetical protein KC589_09865 [Nanoarchaeota archaeon]|nr:hypothetical protein [Nanoarchaeota archaeon]
MKINKLDDMIKDSLFEFISVILILMLLIINIFYYLNDSDNTINLVCNRLDYTNFSCVDNNNVSHQFETNIDLNLCCEVQK